MLNLALLGILAAGPTLFEVGSGRFAEKTETVFCQIVGPRAVTVDELRTGAREIDLEFLARDSKGIYSVIGVVKGVRPPLNVLGLRIGRGKGARDSLLVWDSVGRYNIIHRFGDDLAKPNRWKIDPIQSEFLDELRKWWIKEK